MLQDFEQYGRVLIWKHSFSSSYSSSLCECRLAIIFLYRFGKSLATANLSRLARNFDRIYSLLCLNSVGHYKVLHWLLSDEMCSTHWYDMPNSTSSHSSLQHLGPSTQSQALPDIRGCNICDSPQEASDWEVQALSSFRLTPRASKHVQRWLPTPHLCDSEDEMVGWLLRSVVVQIVPLAKMMVYPSPASLV
ncbi:hypothetical protein O181_002289 [Austropuccinia psidii MF-1]|uniref:Uncharacterized protein n=1 Tax=Austropuccinia psidii MF-1 TaxID=1389203 RepID=A0A9Q3BC49_9BASI|nr:hypothetical protein [Austropuccinia psidii MF-1]